jgi:hypothetical protein
MKAWISLLIASFVLCGCAGKSPSQKIWTQTAPTEWEYTISTVPLGTVHEAAVDTFDASGCNKSQGPFGTLAGAEQFVETACADVNQVPPRVHPPE